METNRVTRTRTNEFDVSIDALKGALGEYIVIYNRLAAERWKGKEGRGHVLSLEEVTDAIAKDHLSDKEAKEYLLDTIYLYDKMIMELLPQPRKVMKEVNPREMGVLPEKGRRTLSPTQEEQEKRRLEAEPEAVSEDDIIEKAATAANEKVKQQGGDESEHSPLSAGGTSPSFLKRIGGLFKNKPGA